MLRRTLLKLFTISPLAPLVGLLACVKQIYLVRNVPGGSDGSAVWTANPQYYRKRLPDLWAHDRGLVEAMADKCMSTARNTDTRAWTLAQWNEELLETKALWGMQRQTHEWEMRRRNEKKRST